MFIEIENNVILQHLSFDVAFTSKKTGRQYASNWLRLSTPDKRTAEGFIEVVEGERADERYYWIGAGTIEPINGVWTRTYSVTPKNLLSVQTQAIQTVKEQARSLLAQTDWYVTRQSETGVAIPADVLAFRQEARTFSNTKEIAILAATTVDGVRLALQ